MNRLSTTSLAATCLALALVAGPAAARIWHVPAEAPTIAAALDLATTGDIVELACGTYYEHDLVLKAGVVLRSEDGVAACATIDAQQQGRVLVAEDLAQPAVLLGLTITGGAQTTNDGAGAGIYCDEASLSMAQCAVQDNEAHYSGGGLFARRGTLLVSSTVFSGNVGENGGGGAARLVEVDGEFLDCRFERNRGIDGAALFLSYTSADFNTCTFFANDGWFFGGAVFCVSYSQPTFRHCTLVGNDAYEGAGIMVAADSHPTIDACIIAFNLVGSGIFVDDIGSGADVSCSDIHGNELGGYAGHIDDQTGLNGNIAVDPAFCDLENGDLSVASASPCLPLNNDCVTLMGAEGQGCVLTATPAAPLAWRLEPNQPNPFNPSTTIAFELDAPAEVSLTVHDLAGRLVAVLQRGPLEAGRHAAVWRGQDDRGRPQPSGTYLYRLQAGAQVEARSMVLVR